MQHYTSPDATLASSHVNSIQRIGRTFRERLISGFSWSLLAAVSLQGSVLLSSIVVARLLGLEDFGIYALLITTVLTVAGVAQGGTGLVAIKFVGEFLATDLGRVARILRMCAFVTTLVGVLTAAALFFLAPFAAASILGKPQVGPYVQWGAVAVVFHVVVAFQYGALQGFGAFGALSRAAVSAGVVHLAATTLGAWSAGLGGAILGFIFASFWRTISFGVALHRVRKQYQVPRAYHIHGEDWKLLGTFALPASMAGLVTLPCLWAVTMLVARQPEGLALVAVFSVVHQIRLTLLQFPSLLNSVSFSVLSRLKGQNESAGYRSVFWASLGINFGFSVLALAVFMPLGEKVLQIYGNDFAMGYSALLLVLMSVLPETLAAAAYQLVQSTGRMWRSFVLIVLPRDLSYLGLAIVLLPTHGIDGAAAAYLIAHVIGLAMTAFLARHATTAFSPQLDRCGN